MVINVWVNVEVNDLWLNNCKWFGIWVNEFNLFVNGIFKVWKLIFNFEFLNLLIFGYVVGNIFLGIEGVFIFKFFFFLFII